MNEKKQPSESEELLDIFTNHLIKRNLSLILDNFSDELKKEIKSDKDYFMKKNNFQNNLLRIYMPIIFFYLVQWRKILKKAKDKIVTLSEDSQKEMILQVLLNYILPLYVTINEKNILQSPPSYGFGTLKYGTTLLGVFPDKNIDEVLTNTEKWHYLYRFHFLIRKHIQAWKDEFLQDDHSKSYDVVEYVYMELKTYLNNTEVILADWCSDELENLRKITIEKQKSLELIAFMLSGKGNLIQNNFGENVYKDSITLGELLSRYIIIDDIMQYENNYPNTIPEISYLKVCMEKLSYLLDVISEQPPGSVFKNKKKYYEILLENMDETLDFSNPDHKKAYNILLSATCMGLKNFKDNLKKDPYEITLWNQKRKDCNDDYKTFGEKILEEMNELQSKIYKLK